MPEWGTKEWFDCQFRDAHTTDGDKWGHRWRASQKYRYKRLLGFIRSEIIKEHEQKILDIGCALGDFTRQIYALNPKNEILGIDISERAVDECRRLHPGMNFQQGAFPNLGLKPESYDGIISLEVIYYLSHNERQKATRKIYNILKSGGWYLFSNCLDDGSRYFTQDGAVELIKNNFSIEKIGYKYDYLYARISQPLMRLVGVCEFIHKVRESIDLQEFDYSESRNRKQLQKLTNVPMIGCFIGLIAYPIGWSTKLFLQLEFVPALLAFLDRLIIGDRARSHIFIKARKVTQR